MPESRILATLSVSAAASRNWDLVILGAGPAGALAARQAAREGAAVLLIDRAQFPRHKVCGCCMNGAALGVLKDVGLGDLVVHSNAPPLRRFYLASRGRFADVTLHQGVALSRGRLDADLIRAAIEAGADFLDDTQALLGPAEAETRSVELKSGSLQASTCAQAIVVAGGLGCRVFAGESSDDRQTAVGSRVGAGAVLADVSDAYETGTIYMACHPRGYVGLVRLEDGRLDIAAALDASAIKAGGGIAELVETILAAAGLPRPGPIQTLTWQGTAKLTQKRERVAGDRYFVIGDAAGYVEPFTGEGMAWALASGQAVVPYALACVAGNGPHSQQGWTDKHRELLDRRVRLCRTVSTLLRYPRLVGIAVRVLAFAPALAQPVVKSLNASFAQD